jgi:hypothetical protein
MSQIPQALTKGEAFAVAALAMPYMVIKTAGRLIGRSLASKPTVAPPAPTPAAVHPPSPAVAPSTAFVAADRVCSVEISGQRVNFYQYFNAKVIRASTRANRRLQEAAFTPAIAEECRIEYDLDGAIEWIREHGFGGARSQPAKQVSQHRDIEQPTRADLATPPFDAPYTSPAAARPGAAKTRAQKPAPSAPAPSLNHTFVPVDDRQGRPFRGRILNFGEETRPGRGDQKPYVTYVLKMESESGQYTKDFLGEHLGELVEQHTLRIGQTVTVQLVAKEHFEVEVNGKMEPRRRNHYSIKVH